MPRISYRRKLFLKKLLRTLLIVAGTAAVVSIVLLIYFEPYVTYDREGRMAHALRGVLGKAGLRVGCAAGAKQE